MENYKERNINEDSIHRALSLLFALIGIFCLLSSLTRHLYWPGKALFWLGGLPLVWIALPTFIVFSLLAFIKGKFPSYAHRINIGMAIALIGIAAIWSHLGLHKEESFDFSLFMGAFNAVKEPSGYFIASSIGGGAIGFIAASILNLGGSSLVYFISTLAILAGLIIIFFPLEKRAYSLILSKLAIHKSKIASEKEREFQEEARRKAIEHEAAIRPIDNNVPFSPFEAPFVDMAQSQVHDLRNAPSLSASNEEESIGKRTDLYHHEDDFITPTQARIIDADASFTNVLPSSLNNAGLQEATYMPEAAIFEASKSSNPLQNGVGEKMETGTQPAPISSSDGIERSSSNPNISLSPSFETPKSSISLNEEPPSSKFEENISQPFESISQAPTIDTSSEVSTPLLETPPTIESSIVEPLANRQSEPIIGSNPIIQDNSSPISHASSVFEATTNRVPGPKQLDVDPLTGEKFATPLPSYILPNVNLLLPTSNNNLLEEQMKECNERMANINTILASFKSGAHVIDYTIGPSVTRFNIDTDSGVTVSSIKRYIQNIQVKLGGIPTRFEEVVPGQMTSGLEIANDNCRTVTMREIFEALPPLTEKTKLYIPFGESISGKIISGDLSKFPHMLISGGTGSGKSVFMQSVIMSLIMRNRPEELKLVMVDPKRVEMAKYDSIPHLLCPIVKDMSQAKICIDKLCHEMERRYTIFEKAGVREIREYNEEYASKKNLRKLPFIVCIIDEFADLMDTFKNVEDPVVRIAQKARAAGIHLIIATQRPTVNIVTGRLKANLSVRVALSMNSAVDSVTILGEAGAEELAGHGDMLVVCPEVLRNGLIRAQGAYVETKEIEAVTNFIRSQSKPQYDPYFMDLVDHEAEAKAAEEAALANAPTRAELRQMAGDDLYSEIKAKVMTQEYASVSRIQRENGIGFPRAGRIFARLQQEGIVASAPESISSSKGCKVLVHNAPNNDGLPIGSNDNSVIKGGDF